MSSIAASTCLERTRRLHRQSAITGYHADVALDAFARQVQALVAVSVRPLRRETIDTIQDAVSQLPEVLSTFVLAGSDHLLVHVGVPTDDPLHALLVDRLSAHREVVSFRTSTIVRRTRKTVLEALPVDRRPRPPGPGAAQNADRATGCHSCQVRSRSA